MESPRINLYDLTREELRLQLVRWEISSHHLKRLWAYLHLEQVSSFAEMPDLPVRLLRRLESSATIGLLSTDREIHSADGFTRKFLLGLNDRKQIETVIMRFTGRVTACISSQAGCAMGCVFCATGQNGFERHLTTGEIVAQANHVQRILAQNGERLRNVVLMGMGEPLHNYDAVMKACDILLDTAGLSLGAKQLTLSTVGVVPGIIRLADEKRPIHLAVSLHGSTQEERAALVPVAKRWPLDELMAACRYFCAKLQRRIFFEWTLIEGKNDSPESAHRLGTLLEGLQAQVNLIPLNPTAGYGGERTRSEQAKVFQRILIDDYSIPSTVRQRRGIDIAAGCGQLAGAER
jgi:23S rRNA (adenine2503-C2)-methyltransferase